MKFSSEVSNLVMNELQGHFRPEFLNRIDEIILFKPLTLENIKGIVMKFYKRIANALS